MLNKIKLCSLIENFLYAEINTKLKNIIQNLHSTLCNAYPAYWGFCYRGANYTYFNQRPRQLSLLSLPEQYHQIVDSYLQQEHEYSNEKNLVLQYVQSVLNNAKDTQEILEKLPSAFKSFVEECIDFKYTYNKFDSDVSYLEYNSKGKELLYRRIYLNMLGA